MISEDAVKSIQLIITIIFTGAISFSIGRAKALIEGKQKVYSESIEPIITRAFKPENVTDKEVNCAVSKLWLYGSKKVTKSLDRVLRIIIDPTRGDIVEATQKLLADMRRDIQILTCQKLKADEFLHIYQELKTKKR